nr:ribonuclease H-like domain-containing protein [Tanacetum cinerariifolium]
MARSDNDSDDASIHNEATNTQQQPNIQPRIITTVSNNNVKFPYLKKDEYENAVKARFGGNAESKKMRKFMLKQEFLEFRIGEADGLHKGYDMMQKILSQLNQLKAKPDAEDINLKVHKFEQKAKRKIDFDKKESARFSKKKTNHDSESDGDIAAKEFSMIAGCDSEDAIKEGAAKLYNLNTGANSDEANTADKIRVLSIELENTSNLLKNSKRINADFETAKKDLQTKLDNHLVQTEKWRNSSKNFFKLIDSSMSVRTKVGLGFTNCISENELGWDDSAFSVFITNSEYVEGRPIFHRFTRTDSVKVVPLPLSRDYTSLSDHIDLDELQMSYGIKSLTTCDSKSMSNDFVSCVDSDKSSEVNTNDFASSDSSVKSLEHKPTDSTSCASTSSVSTSVNEAEIESNVGTPIKKPIIVQDLPSFTCNSSDKNEHISRTSCNKNDYFNKKAGHFRKNASSVSKLCFVCGSGTHLIKDFDFYEK